MSTLLDWKNDDWPKRCDCGESVDNEDEALSHVFDDHRDVITDE